MTYSALHAINKFVMNSENNNMESVLGNQTKLVEQGLSTCLAAAM